MLPIVQYYRSQVFNWCGQNTYNKFIFSPVLMHRRSLISTWIPTRSSFLVCFDSFMTDADWPNANVVVYMQVVARYYPA